MYTPCAMYIFSLEDTYYISFVVFKYLYIICYVLLNNNMISFVKYDVFCIPALWSCHFSNMFPSWENRLATILIRNEVCIENLSNLD